jgi:hypothetical protein
MKGNLLKPLRIEYFILILLLLLHMSGIAQQVDVKICRCADMMCKCADGKRQIELRCLKN